MDVRIAYVLQRNNLDLEERFEAVSMALALRDAGLIVRLVHSVDDVASDEIVLGPSGVTHSKRPFRLLSNTVNRYWEHPLIAEEMKRGFEVCGLRRAGELYDDWDGLFFKSTRPKEFTQAMAGGESFAKLIGDMAYAFCDREHCVLAQELVTVENEARIFIVDRSIVASSPQRPDLTPQHPSPPSPPAELLDYVTQRIAPHIEWSHYNVDVAYINGTPGVVECNPLEFGAIGLYACNPNDIARAVVDAGIFNSIAKEG